MDTHEYLAKGAFAAPGDVPFRLDEGYSEETRSQAEIEEAVQSTESMVTHLDWVMALGEKARADFAYGILRTLRTATIASVVEKLTPFLHMDPVQTLPPEITFQIFSFLDPATLLTASLASKTWRQRIMDSQLWKGVYLSEGWRMDTKEIQEAQRERSEVAQSENRKLRMRQSDTDVGQPRLKKRVPPDGLGSTETVGSGLFGNGHMHWNEQHSAIEADTTEPALTTPSRDEEGDQDMQDASSSDTLSSETGVVRRPSKRGPSDSSGDANMMQISSPLQSPVSQAKITPPWSLKPSLFLQTPSGRSLINYSYLFKQRRRLEENWNKGQFANFQLPHPAHKEEGHRECVYTIQFSGKWLVSGSRDKSIRIWDMETRRLRGPPLLGHSQSVLCLQFDPSEQEDVIISGSSDTNVIVWRFSTGKMVCKIPNAHSESVLNLRFDERYLVTCSKDKLIKIWTRKELTPMDKDYLCPRPDSKENGIRYPSYIIDPSSIPSPVLESQIAKGIVKTLAPYNLMMILEGHGAAVNAVQIDGDEIVSASGDRIIRVWNIKENCCKRSLIGHTKGIACVQFDSKRIVSGSSDNTVRIFDHQTGAEVACLEGHRNLVRTVQAGFGDLPGSEEDLRAEALKGDEEFFRAQEAGEVPISWQHTTRNSRQAEGRGRAHYGSRKPIDKRVIGATLPPGGGGSRWARIVSGSYDESVIIWKRDREGKWKIGHILRQADAVRASSSRRAESLATSRDRRGLLATNQAQLQLLMNAANLAQQGQPNQAPVVTPGGQQGPVPDQAVAAAMLNFPPNGVTAIPADHAMLQAVAHAPAPAPAPALLPQNHHLHAGGHHPFTATSRVFKLQFDARRIICCSQDPRIVVWDFANHDPEIEEASQFFVGP